MVPRTATRERSGLGGGGGTPPCRPARTPARRIVYHPSFDMQPRTRRVQRIHFPLPLTGRLGTVDVAIGDLSVLGARVEHGVPLTAGGHARIVFEVDEGKIEADCRIVRARISR